MTIRRFLRDTRAGATAIAAALAALMTVGGAAVAIDHNWLVDQRDSLKAASSAAGIAATQELGHLLDTQPGISDAELIRKLTAIATRYIVLNLTHLAPDRYAHAISTLVVTVRHSRTGRTVDVSVEADLGGTLLSKALPMLESAAESGPIRTGSQSKSLTNPVEVVMAIDVSISMNELLDGGRCGRRCSNPEDKRIAIVKRAATNLVRVLEPDATNRVAIGVVPWHSTVRLDATTAADWARKGWAEYPAQRVYGEPYLCYGSGCTPPLAVTETIAATAPEPWKGCIDSQRMPPVRALASLPATNEFFSLPADKPFAQMFYRATQGSAYHCNVLPLPSDFGSQICFQGQRYGRFNTSGWPVMPPQYGCDDTNPYLVPLSTTTVDIEQAVNDLKPVGHRTYSALGLLWAQRMLDHSWNGVWGGGTHPVAPEDRDSEGIRKVIVLLTDGEDTHCGFGNPTCTDSTLGFSRADACDAVKAAGTEIFVVAAMHPNKVSQSLGDSLRVCSSDSDDSDVTYAFLNQSTPAELEAAFSEIANQLRTVRRVY